MRSLGENQFHLLMATLLVASLFVEHLARRSLPSWSSPQIGLITFALGLAWVMLLVLHRLRAFDERVRVLQDRLDRLTRRTDAIEDDERARRSLPKR